MGDGRDENHGTQDLRVAWNRGSYLIAYICDVFTNKGVDCDEKMVAPHWYCHLWRYLSVAWARFSFAKATVGSCTSSSSPQCPISFGLAELAVSSNWKYPHYFTSLYPDDRHVRVSVCLSEPSFLSFSGNRNCQMKKKSWRKF